MIVPARLAILTGSLVIALSGCITSGPIIDTAPPPPQPDGTIAGTVRGPGGVAPAEGRLVRATAVDGGKVYEARTNIAGSYSLKVPPGKYRLEVVLQPAERIGKRPEDVIDVDPSDVDAGRDFVLAGAGTADPPN